MNWGPYPVMKPPRPTYTPSKAKLNSVTTNMKEFPGYVRDGPNEIIDHPATIKLDMAASPEMVYKTSN